MVTTTWAEGEVDAGTVTVQAFWPGQLVGATCPLNVATMCPSVLKKFAPEIVMLWPAEPLEGLNDEITGGPLGATATVVEVEVVDEDEGMEPAVPPGPPDRGLVEGEPVDAAVRGGRTGGARGRRSWTGDQRDQQGDCRRADQGGDHGDGAGQPAIAPRRGRTRGRRTREDDGHRLCPIRRLGGGHPSGRRGVRRSVDTCRFAGASHGTFHRPQGALSRRPGRRFGRRMLVCHRPRPVPVPRTIGSTRGLA